MHLVGRQLAVDRRIGVRRVARLIDKKPMDDLKRWLAEQELNRAFDGVHEKRSPVVTYFYHYILAYRLDGLRIENRWLLKWLNILFLNTIKIRIKRFTHTIQK